jgi:hypothetical protein
MKNEEWEKEAEGYRLKGENKKGEKTKWGNGEEG